MANRPARKRAKRARLAVEILDYARESLSDLTAFLEDDQTPLIYEIYMSKHHVDPSIICLVAGTAKMGKPTPQELFLRLLALRSLSTGYAEWMQQKLGQSTLKWGDTGHPENHGLCKAFIREKSLPDTSQTRGWFESGLKFLRIEKDLDIPGLSLALMFALPKFQHFYEFEVSNVITMLRAGLYADIMQVASRLTPLLVGYNRFTSRSSQCFVPREDPVSSRTIQVILCHFESKSRPRSSCFMKGRASSERISSQTGPFKKP